MASHFRKPEEEGSRAVPSPQGTSTASHFALSSDAENAPEAEQTAPKTAPRLSPDDTGAFLASAGVTIATPAPSVTDSAPAPDISAVPDPFAPPVLNVPDPAQPPAPEVTADQQGEVADLDKALRSADFTTVFAPVDEDRSPVSRQADAEPVILMEHVTKIYPAQPNKPALDDVNLAIYPGEFVFVVGHSGSGKSTLLRTMTRDVKPTSGRVLVAGQDLTRIKNRKIPFFRRQIGTVFQDFKLLPGKTVYENVAFVLQCIGKPRGVIRTQVPEVLRLVGLADQMDSMPDQLSGGEQQRVSVARAMVNRPPLLICDEPTGNLDPAISLGIMKLLERINRTGTTVIVATHDREMVDSMHRRVIAIESGHIVRDQERGGYGNYGA